MKPVKVETTPAVDDYNTPNEPKRVRVNANRHEPYRSSQSDYMNRRMLRSNYLALKTLINVQKPREQIADAEALLDIANTLVSSVKTHTSNGVTPSDFVTALLKSFGQPRRGVAAEEENEQVSVKWKDIGLAVSPIFLKGHGVYTMLEPMDAEIKKRKIAVQRRRTRQTGETAQPDELKGSQEEKSDTEKNMAVMFDILRRRKRVTLESLMLNRRSFARSVENLFALSFLLKDGRAEISLDDKLSHFVSPKNAPAANSIGEVSYSHFMFKFGFKDWKLMMTVVPEGEELMPHREQSYAFSSVSSRTWNK